MSEPTINNVGSAFYRGRIVGSAYLCNIISGRPKETIFLNILL